MQKRICFLVIVAVAAVLWSGASTWGDDDFYVIASRGPQGPPGAKPQSPANRHPALV